MPILAAILVNSLKLVKVNSLAVHSYISIAVSLTVAYLLPTASRDLWVLYCEHDCAHVPCRIA